MATLTPAQKRDLALTDAAMLRQGVSNKAAINGLDARVDALEAAGMGGDTVILYGGTPDPHPAGTTILYGGTP